MAKTGIRLVLLIAVALLALAVGCAQAPAMGAFGSAHDHADFRVYVDGQAYNFSQERYMTPTPPGGDQVCGNDSRLAHLHDMDGDLVHVHATGVTWGYFFFTLNMSLANGCLRLDNGTSYCDSMDERWRYFVNGTEVSGLKDVRIRNLDRVLLTYGANDAQMREQMDSVAHKAGQEKEGAGVCAPAAGGNGSAPS